MKPYYYVIPLQPVTQYSDLESAQADASRLAQASPGIHYEVLKCVATVSCPLPDITTVWHDEPNELVRRPQFNCPPKTAAMPVKESHWLNHLPKWIADRARSNMKDYGILFGYDETVFDYSFSFRNSPEGEIFWYAVGEFLDEGTPESLPDGPPDDAENNPGNLSRDQIGKGWRLLRKSEIKDRKTHRGIQRWNRETEEWTDGGWVGDCGDYTYRTQIVYGKLDGNK